MNRTLSRTIRWITPPIVWDAYVRFRKLGWAFPWFEFDRMATCSDPKPLLDGRFGKIHDRYRSLDPFAGEAYRYRHYNICYFAGLCRSVPGDFVCAGVSFGATAKILYEYVDFPTLGKTLHLIDPIEGTVEKDSDRTTPNFNRDADYVMRQFSSDAPIILHRKYIPLRLPGPLAFVLTDTGTEDAVTESLPIFYEALSRGGIVICNEYSRNIDRFDSIVSRLGASPFWLPSGQGVIIKP
jgi:hypothetical protein